MVIFVDNIGFGIHVKSGNKSHKFHPKVNDNCLQFPKRLLYPHKKWQCYTQWMRTYNHVIHNIMCLTKLEYLSRQNISYMRDDYVKKIGDESKSSSEKIIDYLRDKEYNYIALCHQDVASRKEGECSAMYCTLNSEKEHNISCEKELEMLEYAKTHRHLYKLTGD